MYYHQHTDVSDHHRQTTSEQTRGDRERRTPLHATDDPYTVDVPPSSGECTMPTALDPNGQDLSRVNQTP